MVVVAVGVGGGPESRVFVEGNGERIALAGGVLMLGLAAQHCLVVVSLELLELSSCLPPFLLFWPF